VINLPLLSVSQLTQLIKKRIEASFSSVRVKGEVSNLRKQASGHLYFTLKDGGAQIATVLFKGDAFRLKEVPRVGDAVVVTGELSVYPPRGNYQLIARQIEPAGLGELLLKLHKLKSDLQKRGWFDPKHKKPLPKYPEKIGVVTSPTGAVIQDIVNILNRRFKPFHLILNPVRVQGEGAAEEIARAIADFNRFELVDLLIIGRGGGSLEDLWPFNDERVARAILHSKIPIISSVGHGTDTLISDLVADVSAPTPSAAAELAVREYSSQATFLKEVESRARQNLKQVILHCRSRLKGALRLPLFISPAPLLATKWQQVDEAIDLLETKMKSEISEKQMRVTSAKAELKSFQPLHRLKSKREALRGIQSQIDNGGRG